MRAAVQQHLVSSQTKVTDATLTLCINQDVAGLEISVDDSWMSTLRITSNVKHGKAAMHLKICDSGWRAIPLQVQASGKTNESHCQEFQRLIQHIAL